MFRWRRCVWFSISPFFRCYNSSTWKLLSLLLMRESRLPLLPLLLALDLRRTTARAFSRKVTSIASLSSGAFACTWSWKRARHSRRLFPLFCKRAAKPDYFGWLTSSMSISDDSRLEEWEDAKGWEALLLWLLSSISVTSSSWAYSSSGSAM